MAHGECRGMAASSDRGMQEKSIGVQCSAVVHGGSGYVLLQQQAHTHATGNAAMQLGMQHAQPRLEASRLISKTEIQPYHSMLLCPGNSGLCPGDSGKVHVCCRMHPGTQACRYLQGQRLLVLLLVVHDSCQGQEANNVCLAVVVQLCGSAELLPGLLGLVLYAGVMTRHGEP